ncbi:MAG: hypothetical protein II045_05305, partial [Oscillospiraceae bacterium]|nr:hypothetical protein [Oscillospiraceae bacterium]
MRQSGVSSVMRISWAMMEDIYLFFRKFSSDFSEKSGFGKVTLTNDAIDLLINYRWPGNIRQLKNVTESVTAFESEKLTPTSGRCVVDAATLAHYMPKEDVNLLPAVLDGNRGDSMPDSDRQMFIKAILDLKQEVDDLKARMSGMTASAAPVLNPHVVAEEAEWQGQGAPVSSEEIGKVVDINVQESPEQDLSLRKSNL